MVRNNPVFFHDHMERLESSVRNQKKDMAVDVGTIKKDIIKLTKTDRKKEVNLKIVFNYTNDSVNYLVYYIEPIYPSEKQYREGVNGILFHAERKDPGSKVINHKLRSSIFHKLILEGGYEALLVNEKGQITEGSRSNIFFMKNNTLVTAPDSVILCGITRKYILDICSERKIPVRKVCVNADCMADYEAAFMTGTSTIVLAFSRINDREFNVNVPLIGELRRLYMIKAEESIKRFRSE